MRKKRDFAYRLIALIHVSALSFSLPISVQAEEEGDKPSVESAPTTDGEANAGQELSDRGVNIVGIASPGEEQVRRLHGEIRDSAIAKILSEDNLRVGLSTRWTEARLKANAPTELKEKLENKTGGQSLPLAFYPVYNASNVIVGTVVQVSNGASGNLTAFVEKGSYIQSYTERERDSDDHTLRRTKRGVDWEEVWVKVKEGGRWVWKKVIRRATPVVSAAWTTYKMGSQVTRVLNHGICARRCSGMNWNNASWCYAKCIGGAAVNGAIDAYIGN